MPERPNSMPRPLGAILLGAALALHAVALWRTHVLLGGDRPVLGALLGVLALGAAVAGRGRSQRALWPAVAGAVLVAVGAFAAPLLFARLPSSVTPLVACVLLAVPALALGGLGRRSLPAALLGGGLGALAGALLLPFASPAGASLVAAILLAAGALLHRGSAPLDPAPGTPGPNVLGHLAAILAGALLAGAAFAVVGGGSHPWPARPAQAGFLLLGTALGLVVGRRATGTARTGLLAAVGILVAAIGLLPQARDVVDRAVGALAVSPSHPAVGVAGGLLTLLAGAALAGGIAGFGAGLAGAFGSRRAQGLALGAAAFVAVAFVAAHASRHELTELAADPPSHARYGLLDGHVVAWDAADRLPDDLFAAHVGALAATGRGRAVVLGWGSPRTLQALSLHGFTSVVEAGPGTPGAPGLQASGRVPPSIVVRGREDLAALGSCDLVVSNLEDPSLPANEAFFTEAAQQSIRRLLLPGGVFVQRLSLDRLGPEGVARHAMLLRRTFPSTWLATADLGRGGSVLAVCLGPPGRPAPAPPAPPSAPAPLTATTAPKGPDASTDPSLAANPELGAPRPGTPVATAPVRSAGPDVAAEPLLPARLLTAAGRLSPDVAASLRQARLLDAEQILATIAAGPQEIDALGSGVGPHDPWLPGSLAFRHPAPPDVARDLAQAMLYGRLSYVDVRYEPLPRAGEGTHPEQWDLVGMESRLGPAWTGESAVIRYANHLGRVFGHPAVSRDEARRLVLQGSGKRLEIRRRRAADAPRQTLAAALADLEGPSLRNSGGAVVHGHEALWMFEQEGTARQEITLAWYCPAQGSLFTAELVLTGSDVRPGLYQEPLRLLSDDIRCRHPRPPEPPPAEADAAPGAGTADGPRP